MDEVEQYRQTVHKQLTRRLGTAEASKDRDDFKRGYAQALEYAMSIVRAEIDPMNGTHEDTSIFSPPDPAAFVRPAMDRENPMVSSSEGRER